MKKSKLVSVIVALALLTMLSATTQGTVVVIPELKASPDNSHLFRVSGADFNVSNPVTLQLFNGTDALYKFTEAISTNDTGKFDAIVVAPTTLAGTFNLTATSQTVADAYNVTGTVQITLPDMTGSQGVAGINGTQGPQGEQGITGPQGVAGEATNTDSIVAVAVVSLIFSILAVSLALFYKKP
jgi:hypothetical protein